MIEELDRRLLGRWLSMPESSGDEQEIATLEFLSDGSLTYKVVGREKDQVMLLTFRTERGHIVSDQPSAPHAERTPYSFTDDGKLLLAFGGELLTYVRAD
jgi:hypothetical protein